MYRKQQKSYIYIYLMVYICKICVTLDERTSSSGHRATAPPFPSHPPVVVVALSRDVNELHTATDGTIITCTQDNGPRWQLFVCQESLRQQAKKCPTCRQVKSTPFPSTAALMLKPLSYRNHGCEKDLSIWQGVQSYLINFAHVIPNHNSPGFV